jgi:hypothetical protein
LPASSADGASSAEGARFAAAVARFDEVHRTDPRGELYGIAAPYAVHYHQRLATWLAKLAPNASESLRLAAHCQHLRRWSLPRGEYPKGRVGYKRWRKDLAKRHAVEAAAILDEVGYGRATCARVGELLQKKDLARDPEVQQFEDAICMVFVESQLADFAKKHDEQKLTRVIAKTHKKMSPAGQQHLAAMLPALPLELRSLVERALS